MREFQLAVMRQIQSRPGPDVVVLNSHNLGCECNTIQDSSKCESFRTSYLKWGTIKRALQTRLDAQCKLSTLRLLPAEVLKYLMCLPYETESYSGYKFDNTLVYFKGMSKVAIHLSPGSLSMGTHPSVGSRAQTRVLRTA